MLTRCNASPVGWTKPALAIHTPRSSNNWSALSKRLPLPCSNWSIAFRVVGLSVTSFVSEGGTPSVPGGALASNAEGSSCFFTELVVGGFEGFFEGFLDGGRNGGVVVECHGEGALASGH